MTVGELDAANNLVAALGDAIDQQQEIIGALVDSLNEYREFLLKCIEDGRNG